MQRKQANLASHAAIETPEPQPTRQALTTEQPRSSDRAGQPAERDKGSRAGPRPVQPQIRYRCQSTVAYEVWPPAAHSRAPANPATDRSKESRQIFHLRHPLGTAVTRRRVLQSELRST